MAALRPAFNDAAAHEPEETADPHLPSRKISLFSLHANVPQRMSLGPAAAAATPLDAATAQAPHPGPSLNRLDPARGESIDDPEVAAVAEAGVTEAGVTEAGVADGIAIQPSSPMVLADVREAGLPPVMAVEPYDGPYHDVEVGEPGLPLVMVAAEPDDSPHHDVEGEYLQPAAMEAPLAGPSAPEPAPVAKERLDEPTAPAVRAARPGLFWRFLLAALGGRSSASAVARTEVPVTAAVAAADRVAGVADAAPAAVVVRADNSHKAEVPQAVRETMPIEAPKAAAAEPVAVREPDLHAPAPRQPATAVSSSPPDVVDTHPEGEPAIANESAIDPSPTRQPVAIQEDAKRSFELDAAAPVVLFAGDVSAATGADILFDAITTICSDNAAVQFVFAGDGSLRAGLADRAARADLGARCRFLGHVTSSQFERVLTACDFVVIPARVPQDEALAQMALAHGKPVVATHQASLGCIAHGRNGLVTYDNPGSMVWGIRELLGPLYGNIRRQFSNAA